MREELIDGVVREVERRLRARPTALLIGEKPPLDFGWDYVSEGYGAVVLGSLTPYELLNFPDERCLCALLEGKPVYLWEEGLLYRKDAKTAERGAWTRMLAAERQLRQWGVRPLRAPREKLLTAQEVRRLLANGQPVNGRLTPLARDVLEGKQCGWER